MRRACTAAVAIVLAGLLAGCSATRGPDPVEQEARELLDRAQQLVDDADGGHVTFASWVEKGYDDPVGYCLITKTEPSSVAPDRAEIMSGSPSGLGNPLCTVGASFLSDGDTVYVPDLDVDGRIRPMYYWATVDPDVLAATRDAPTESDVAYADVLEHATRVEVEPGKVVVGVEAEAASAVVGDGGADLGPGTAEFSLADDGMLTEARYTFRGSDATTVVLHRFEDMGLPQGLEMPREDDLHPESDPIETEAALAGFVGIG